MKLGKCYTVYFSFNLERVENRQYPSLSKDWPGSCWQISSAAEVAWGPGSTVELPMLTTIFDSRHCSPLPPFSKKPYLILRQKRPEHQEIGLRGCQGRSTSSGPSHSQHWPSSGELRAWRPNGLVTGYLSQEHLSCLSSAPRPYRWCVYWDFCVD